MKKVHWANMVECLHLAGVRSEFSQNSTFWQSVEKIKWAKVNSIQPDEIESCERAANTMLHCPPF